MKARIKPAVLILSLIMLISDLSGCGKNVPIGPAATNTVMAYSPEYIQLPQEISCIIDACVHEDRIYLAALLESDPYGDEDASDCPALYRMNIDGTDITGLSGYNAPALPDGSRGNIYLSAIDIDNDGEIWVTEYDASASVIYLRKLDTEGNELLRSDISYIAEGKENTYINDLKLDSNGNIYISDFYSGVYVFNDKGINSFEAASAGYLNNLVHLSDGTVAAYILDTPDTLLKTIDPETKNWGTEIPFMFSPGVFSGSGKNDFYYNDGSCLYGYSISKRESSEVLSWLDCGMDCSGISCLDVLPDGTIICCTNSLDGEKPDTGLAVISMKAVEANEKTVLRLACFRLDDYIQGAVRKFNSENSMYEIEVIDYSEYNTKQDSSAGYLKLDTEILAGNIPDLICSNRRLLISKYAAHGLLEDLYPYLDKDSAPGGRDAFIPEVMKAMETDGALYRIAPGFSIYTSIGRTDIVGDKSDWTYSELTGLLDRYPEGTQLTPYTTAQEALSFLATNMNEFIDWQTGECRYNDGSFLELLELAARFPLTAPAGDDYATQLIEGRALFIVNSISDFLDFQIYKAMFQGDITCIGFPTGNGSESRFMVTKGLSMSSKCEHKDAAWDFIRYVISEEYQKTGTLYEYPTNKTAFDLQAEKAMTPNTYINEYGEEVEIHGIGSFGNITISIHAATQEDIDMVMELIRSTERLAELDMTVLQIIQEEALPFFNGQRSASDAAALIQSRVSTYINEQK